MGTRKLSAPAAKVNAIFSTATNPVLEAAAAAAAVVVVVVVAMVAVVAVLSLLPPTFSSFSLRAL